MDAAEKERCKNEMLINNYEGFKILKRQPLWLDL